MNQPFPKVSVIIPCYNLGQYIDEAVDSVLAQTYRNFEIIIVNDGSTDEETINILKNYNKPKTEVLHTTNQGVSAARNTGIQGATGKYIICLDADDKICNTYLEKAVKVLEENQNIGIVDCEVELFGEQTGRCEFLPEYQLSLILLVNCVYPIGVFRKSDWERTNGYNSNMIYGWEDHDFWLSIIELGREVVRLPEVLFFYRQRSGSRDKSIQREQFIYLYAQLFKNHTKLYSENIEIIFKYILDLRSSVWKLEDQLEKNQVEATLNSLNLREINLVVFPDWCQPEESLSFELNDRDLQHQYGNLVHQITAANYPKWVEPLSLHPLQENQKIRVGYISAYLHAYSGTYWLLGWLRHGDRQNFEIYCYYTGNDPDIITQQFQQYSDVFHHIPGNLEAVSQQILDDRLHILVFPEIGMDAPTIPIASLRLAPVQCTAWGHPVTSGLPTIDYYLSSELMEPENAQEHYTETLIRLPNLAIAYPKPDIPALTKTRSDFALRDDAVVYLCCQAPFKYLPQHDFIFTEIARHVPQAQFVFIRADNLKPRLLKAFAAAGLKCEDYCVFLPGQARFDYLMLNLLCDVYLDSFGFSGGNTTLDAIACNLPIVTCPGEFMRGRLSYAMLTRLGLSETIAQDEAEYIDIAVRLGLEPVWRDWIVQYTAEHHDCLYNDTTCVAALEEFYQRVVQEGLTQR
jgi:predicted O-linked N-acetylglucosamine transferase (SPINDLY family)